MLDHQDSVFKAFADRNRRAMVAALCSGPQRAGELARRVGLAPNAVSFHLRWLKSVGLVSVRREGRWLWYSVQARNLRSWLDSLGASFQITGAAAGGDLGAIAAAEGGPEATVEDRARASGAKGGPKRRTGRRARGSVIAKGSPTRGGDNVATDTLPDELL